MIRIEESEVIAILTKEIIFENHDKEGLINNLNFLKTSNAYKIWKRKIKKYKKINSASQFKLLEIGFGGGYFIKNIEKWFKKCIIIALEIDINLINYAKESSNKTKFILNDCHMLPFRERTFDVICSFQVIEHLKQPKIFLQEVKRTLKDNGLFILSTPNPSGIAAKILKQKWQGYRYDHISLKYPWEWRESLLKTGFLILDEGTTLLSGFPLLQKIPFALINWIPLFIMGFFHWYKGESYIAIAKK